MFKASAIANAYFYQHKHLENTNGGHYEKDNVKDSGKSAAVSLNPASASIRNPIKENNIR